MVISAKMKMIYPNLNQNLVDGFTQTQGWSLMKEII